MAQQPATAPDPDSATPLPVKTAEPDRLGYGEINAPGSGRMRGGMDTTSGIVDKHAANAAKEQPTEINAQESTYNSDTHLAIFIGNVEVKDPEFNVVCGRLTATLKHGPQAAAPNGKPIAARPAPAKSPSRSKESASQGGLQKAIADAAEGGVVTITQDKAQPDGSIKHSTGHALKAIYDANTGDVSLSGGKPDMVQEKNLTVALDSNTVLILNRDGRMRAVGPSKTYIIQEKPANQDASGAAPNKQ